jgi:long-chain acyl-CoA synthetase
LFLNVYDPDKEAARVSDFMADGLAAEEVAAIGVPDAKSGEVIKVFVVKKDQSLTEEELKKYCHENLTNYKIPRHIEFRTELPKTNVGKILRRALKEQEAAAAA